MIKINQEIPWYRSDYLKQEWLVRKSSHYVFYYLKDSLAEKDIDRIIELKENHYNKILSFLNLGNKKIIHYYIYSSSSDKINLMGDNSQGNAIWGELELFNGEVKINKFEIHVIYNDECQFIGEHEDTHLLSLPMGLSIYLFYEGLAQFMEGNLFGKDIDFISKELLDQNKMYPIEDLIDNKNWEKLEPKIIYPEVGSFTRFLINTYGWNEFREIYQKLSRLNSFKDNIEIIECGFERSIKEIEREWKDYLMQN